MTQAYADRRVQQPDWWPADCEWSAATANNLEHARLNELFIVMRDWTASIEVRGMHPFGAAICSIPVNGSLRQQAQAAGDAGCPVVQRRGHLLPRSIPVSKLGYGLPRRRRMCKLKLPGGAVMPPQGPGPGRAVLLERQRQVWEMQAHTQTAILDHPQSAVVKSQSPDSSGGGGQRER